MTKLISGRVAKVGSANVSVDRYQFIGLSETEPDLGLPAVSGYVLSSDLSGNRIWVDAASASGSPFFANTSGIANVALTANIANTVLTLSNFTTANLVEGINLYYTNARVYANITAALSGNLTFGNITVNAITANSYTSTGNITAGNVIANGAFFGSGTGGSVTGANLISATNIQGNIWIGLYTANVIESASNLYYTNARVLSAILPYLTTSNVAEGSNLYYTNARVNSYVQPFLTTANVSEVNNLYYTNARVISAILPYLTTSNVAEGSNLYYTNARVYSNVIATLAGNITIGNATIGNVSVSGSATFGAGTGGSLTGANLLSASYIQTGNLLSSSGNILITGNIIPSIDSTFNFGSLDKQWKDFYLSAESLYVGGQKISGNAQTGLTLVSLTASNITTGNIVVANSLVGNVTGTVSSLSNFTTSNLAEGTNQYFTNARVTANLSQQSVNVFSDVDTTGITTNGILVWNGSSFIAGTIDSGATANIALFANTAGTANVAQTANVANTVLSLSGLTTANLLEANVNLYYTNSRVRTAFVAGDNIVIESNGRISANISLEVANLNTVISNLTTNSITEGNQNLYYTNGRVISAVTPLLTTANVIESASNLYYTNARTRSALSGGTGVSYDNGTGVISIGQNVSATANVTFLNVSVTNNLTVYGNVTTYGANNVSISDNMIYLNSNSSVSNPDIGFAFNYNDGVYRHGGFFRDASDGTFKVFENYSPEPDANIFIDTAHASFRLANIQATTFFGNVSGTAGTVSSLTNLTTSNLAEGTNLYYTNARVNSNVIAFLPSLAGQNIIIQANGQISANVDLSNVTILTANVVALAAQVISLSNQTTSNIAEGSNLYYTNARVRTAFTAGKGITISESGIINNTGSSTQYNTGIDGTVGANILATMSSVVTFPTTTATDRYLLRSIHLVNTSGSTALVSSNILYATGNTAYMANAIPVAPGGVMEFIKTYQIFQPGDKINLQGFNAAGTATANLMSVMLTYETFYNDTSYMGVGQTITTSGTNTSVYNSANSYSIIESIKIVNLQSSNIPVTCYWGDANGVPRAHLAYGLQIPPNSSVELLQSTKRINQYDSIYVSYTGGATNGVSAFVSARYGPAYTIGTYTSTGLPGNTITASFGTSANEGTGLYYTIE
jgi:hypothetical protein